MLAVALRMLLLPSSNRIFMASRSKTEQVSWTKNLESACDNSEQLVRTPTQSTKRKERIARARCNDYSKKKGLKKRKWLRSQRRLWWRLDQGQNQFVQQKSRTSLQQKQQIIWLRRNSLRKNKRKHLRAESHQPNWIVPRRLWSQLRKPPRVRRSQ